MKKPGTCKSNSGYFCRMNCELCNDRGVLILIWVFKSILSGKHKERGDTHL